MQNEPKSAHDYYYLANNHDYNRFLRNNVWF